MITVAEAESIILNHCRDYGTESVSLLEAFRRVLAVDIRADRDFPPFNRVSMDGIAIRFVDWEAGGRIFRISGVQAAGVPPLPELQPVTSNADVPLCVEIMTGAVLPEWLDTVIPYEKCRMEAGNAMLSDDVATKGQHIHRRGTDRIQGDILLEAGERIGSAAIAIAATVGQEQILVRKLPRVTILSSGDELVDVGDTPLPFQIRRSNSYGIYAALLDYGIEARLLHVPDDTKAIRQTVEQCLETENVLLLSGGISMGKFDHVPEALEQAGVTRLFHKVRQRPGKPFWFGAFGKQGVVFALPGNPVSSFACFYRYVIPWLNKSLELRQRVSFVAELDRDVVFKPDLTYLMQVRLRQLDDGKWCATPEEGRGSGDLGNLTESNAFMELPAGRDRFLKGECFPVYPFAV